MIKLRSVLITTLLSLFLMITGQQSVHAGMVTTQQLLTENPIQINITQARKDIETQLIELGVAQQDAFHRVASMTDSQIESVTSQLSELPAGASARGIILTVFIVFVITDVLGATDIFPFIKPMK